MRARVDRCPRRVTRAKRQRQSDTPTTTRAGRYVPTTTAVITEILPFGFADLDRYYVLHEPSTRYVRGRQQPHRRQQLILTAVCRTTVHSPTMADNDKLEHQCLVSDDKNYDSKMISLETERVVRVLLICKLFCIIYFYLFLAKRIRVGAERRGTLDIAPT